MVTAADAPIHASGHGWQEELKLMLNLTKPKYVFPFHGDHKRLRLHADLAESVGIDRDNIFIGRNGLALEIDEKGARFGEDVHASMIFVDGVSVGEPDEVAIRDRRKLSDDGVFIVVAAISTDDGSQVVDTGLMFPTAEMLGIDLVLPDFSMLRERAEDIEAIVLTHGHEDHVGALPYVLREIGMPPKIYGGLLTIGMVRSKLDEHKLREAPLEELPAGKRIELGPFGIEMVHMSHSIPDACAVALTTEVGTVLITGDYKFDQTPVDGNPADVSRLAELGREGILCLCGDSTNADRPGIAPSESSVGPALLEVFGRCEGRIIVTSFASNIHRVQQAIDAAAQLDRKVALVGRSMRKNFNIASNLGIADAPEGALHPAEGDRGLPRSQGGRDLDRQPGRAAVGAAADGPQRPPRRRSCTRATR